MFRFLLDHFLGGVPSLLVSAISIREAWQAPLHTQIQSLKTEDVLYLGACV